MALKLFVCIFVSTVGLLLLLAYVSTQRMTSIWTRSYEVQAASTGAVIEHALTYAMLLNRKDELHTSLRNIAKEPSIEALRLYDKNGRVAFSTDPAEVGRRVRKSDQACASCHESEESPPLHNAGWSRILQDRDGREVLTRVQPIANQAQCSDASCHAHARDRTVLGVLDLRLSVDAIRDGQSQAQRSVVLAGLLLAVLSGAGSALFIRRFVRRPVHKLTLGARSVAAGHLDTRIDVDGPGEFGELALAFNDMTAELERARERAEGWEEELTRAVDEKTKSLTLANQKLLHMEKMASLGKLAATVAHEINNPLAGILVYAKLTQRELSGGPPPSETLQEIRRYLEVIRQESARCGDIVKHLLSFAREARFKPAEHHLSSIVERSVLSVRHLLQEPGIDCHIQPPLGDDTLVCDGDQLQQVLVALLVNAVEAMPEGGRIDVRMFRDGEHVCLEVADTGVGIEPDVLPHVFEPFFSTKGNGKGAGLGLAVVYGIVRRHGGSIDVESIVGGGSAFRLTLPRQPAAQDPTGVQTHLLSG